ncbi:InlB B-repeat-containing protein, partial [Bifidobacterium vespertilionis]|uniref:InlB B-repeat-containing protein n=1 Tax=Bifidobacterium vespertilionis TaxID=2562524 RepID=UPI001BDC228B
ADKPSVDKSDLQAAVDAAGELTESDYTAESWEAFASALRNASTVLADDKAVQADVDGALWRLVAARDALVKAEQPAPVDKTGLQAAVDEAGKLVESEYTAESWESFARALDMARTVLADPNATADDVAAALRQLATARDALVKAEQPGPGTPASPMDRARLAARIQEIRDLDLAETDYTADSWKALQDALAAGEGLLGADGLTVERVDRAIESIDAAYKGLVKAEEPSANTPPTLSGVGDATVMVGDAFDYYAGVAATDKEDGLLPVSQIEVEGRVDTSKPGRYELAYTATDHQGLKSERVTRWVTVVERTVQVDKSRLQALVDEYSKLTATDYTGASWKPFEAALEVAKAVLAKADATQSEVDAAHDALRAAWIGLVRVGDRSALEAAVAEARRIQPGGYTTDSWTRFAKALDNAEAVLAKGDATQSELDAAQARLTAAIAGLKVRPSEPSGPSGPSVSYVTVTFDSQGGSAVADRVVVSGTTVEAPAAPVRDGYAFYRWTTDAAGSQPYDFGKPVSSSLTLYAQWKVPVYRLYNPYMAQGASHLYTVNRAEYDYLKTQGWNQEGVAFLTDSKDAGDVRPVYRLYNRYDGSHHYTLDPGEYEYLKTQGWTQEGEAWYASDTQGSDVYRLYNRYTGEHLWTTSQGEYDYLESQGWTQEGVAFRAYLA